MLALMICTDEIQWNGEEAVKCCDFLISGQCTALIFKLRQYAAEISALRQEVLQCTTNKCTNGSIQTEVQLLSL